MSGIPAPRPTLDCPIRKAAATLLLVAVLIAGQIGWPPGRTYALYQSVALMSSVGLPLGVLWGCRRRRTSGEAGSGDWLAYDTILSAVLLFVALWNVGFSVDYAVYMDGAWREHIRISTLTLVMFYPLILIVLSLHDWTTGPAIFFCFAAGAQCLLTIGVVYGPHADVFLVGTVGGGVVGAARRFRAKRSRSMSVTEDTASKGDIEESGTLLEGVWLLLASITVLMYAASRNLSFGMIVTTASFGIMWSVLYFVLSWTGNETASGDQGRHHGNY